MHYPQHEGGGRAAGAGPAAEPRLALPGLFALYHPQATVDDLKARFAELKPKYYPSRQRFTLPPAPGTRSGEALAPGKPLAGYGLRDGSALIFKDLGPQASHPVCAGWDVWGLCRGTRGRSGPTAGPPAWRPVGKLPWPHVLPSSFFFLLLPLQIAYRTVFFWEYFGPLAVYPLFYFLPQVFYSVPS